MSKTESLLLEIGVEELPASYVDAALTVLPELFSKRLAALRLTHGAIRVMGTPRRLAVIVEGLATQQPDLNETVMGPPARVAFDKEGKPTKAAEAFAKKLGCEFGALTTVETPKGAYLSGVMKETGKPSIELLGLMLGEICAAIPFRKSMRWSDGEVAFGRPVRWLVAIFGERVVDFSYAGLASWKSTRGHRFLSPEHFEIKNADSYEGQLQDAHVVVDPKKRADRMVERLTQAAGAVGATLVHDDFLVRENLNLVEEPYVITGGFEKEFLGLPEDVIVAVAKGHQRYFCARGAEGHLAPIYLAVAGTAQNPENVRRGNDRVMRARLSDARFFFEEDLKVGLEERRAKLSGIVFQDRLGSVLDKVERMERVVPHMAGAMKLSADVCDVALEGARLCKCDLATLMVGEFPELQGEMGREYARRQGRRAEVAEVIYGHYQPKGASDDTASTDPAAVVALVDRLDTLVGCFSVGLSPTGAADPYALRRACLGVIRTVLDRGWDISVKKSVALAYEAYAGKKLDLRLEQVVSKLSDFFRDRLRGVLTERYPTDVVDACLAAGYDRPSDVRDRVQALSELEASLRSKAGEVFKRATNIAKEAPSGEPVDPKQVATSDVHDSEIAVYRALSELDSRLKEAQEARNYPAAFSAIASFAPLLGVFFEAVFVMTDEIPVRENRLRLMRAISERCSGVAHFNLLA
jgi:glycyl-tRNA synthetase beta chain